MSPTDFSVRWVFSQMKPLFATLVSCGTCLGRTSCICSLAARKMGREEVCFYRFSFFFPRCTKLQARVPDCSACCTKVTGAITWLVREDDPRKSKNAATETAAITPISNQLPIFACCMYKAFASFPKSDTLGVLHR